MAQSKLYYTTSARVNEIPVVNGQIIFVPDIDAVYLDMQNHRFTYSLIHTYATDAERQNLESPLDGFYFIEATHLLWRFSNNQWTQITSQNLTPLYYGEDENDFPESGIKNTLYYTDSGIYNWKEESNQYNLIANASRWEVL